jgi:type IV secretory pathway VirB6-like protein
LRNLIVCFFFLLPSVIWAQADLPKVQPATSVGSMLTSLLGIGDQIKDFAYANATNVMPLANDILLYVGGAIFLWNIAKVLIAYFSSSDPSLIFSTIFEFLLTFAVISFVLINYVDLLKMIDSVFTQLMAAITGGGDNPLRVMIATIGDSITKIPERLKAVAGIEPGDWWSTVLVKILSNIIALLLVILLAIVTMAAMLATAVVAIFYWALGDVLFAVAAILGPFAIALAIWPFTLRFIEQWIGFISIALGYKVVVTTMMVLLQNLMTQGFVNVTKNMDKTLENVAGICKSGQECAGEFTGLLAVGPFLLVLAYSVLMLWLFLEIRGITNAIFPGAISLTGPTGTLAKMIPSDKK